MAEEVEDLQPLPRRKPVRPEPAARELLKAADLIRGALNPVALAGNGVIRGGASPALREFVRATGIPVAETFMGKGSLDADDPKFLGTVGLQSNDYKMAGFEDADVVHRDRLRPGRARAVALEPRPRQDDRLHRLGRRRGRRELHPRGRARRRHLPHPLAAGRGVPARAALGRIGPAAPGRRRARSRSRPATTHFPMQPPRALYEIRQALGRGGHPGLRRRPAQAVDRAHVPGLRAEHRADRERPGRHGLRGPGGDRGEARAPGPQGRDGERRRRLPHELPGARDGDAAEDAVRERSSGRTSSTARSSGSRTTSSAGTSASTSRTRTS